MSEGKTAADETSAEPETARTEHTEETLTEQKEAVGDTKSSAETEQSEGELLNSKAHDAQTDGMDSDAVVSTEAVTAQTPESETQSELASTDGSQPETETSTAEESQSQTEENASLPETEASTGESASKDMEQPPRPRRPLVKVRRKATVQHKHPSRAPHRQRQRARSRQRFQQHLLSLRRIRQPHPLSRRIMEMIWRSAMGIWWESAKVSPPRHT